MLLSGEIKPGQTGRHHQTHGTNELRLRVLDRHRSGPVVRITARRCTLGSAPSCTVRLRALGIRPVHCAIVQTDGGWVVHSLSTGNRLNGRPFRAAPLCAGDTLVLGPLTFQVLDTIDSPPATAPSDDREPACASVSQPADPRASAPSLDEQFTARIEQMERQLAQLESRTESIDAARQVDLCDSAPAADEDFVARIEQLERQLTQLEQRANAEETESGHTAAIQASAAALERLTSELHEQRGLLDHERENWSRERQRLTDDLAERLRRLSLLEAQLTEQQQSRRELESEFHQRQTQYAAQQLHWSNEKTDLERGLAAARQQAELLGTEQTQLAERWRAQCQTLEDQLQSQRTTLAQQQDQLRELQDLRAIIARQGDEQRQWEEERGQLVAELEELRAAHEESLDAALLGHLPEGRAESLPLTGVESWPEIGVDAKFDETETGTELVTETAGVEDSRACDESAPTTDRAVDLQSLDSPPEALETSRQEQARGLLTRLHDMGIWREEDATRPPESAADSSTADGARIPQGPQQESAQSSQTFESPQGHGAGHEEESIEDYMHRLLHRLRGPEVAAQLAPPSSPASDKAQDPGAEEPEAKPLTPQAFAEFRPRSAAPELTVNLAAMRALANDSARCAIATHRKKGEYLQVLLYLLGSLVTCCVAVCVWNEFRANSLVANTSLACGLIAAGYGLSKYWGLRRRTRRAIHRATDTTSPRDHAAEEAAPAPAPAPLSPSA